MSMSLYIRLKRKRGNKELASKVEQVSKIKEEL